MKKGFFLLGLAALLGTAPAATAQFLKFSKDNGPRRKPLFQPYSTVGLGLGTAHYYGETNSIRQPLQSTFGMMRWNVTANYTRFFTPRLGARVALTYARLAGDDNRYSPTGQFGYLYVRNAHFRNDVKELSVVGIYDLVPQGQTFLRRQSLVPYIFGGIALFAHNPKARSPRDSIFDNRWVRLQPLGTEGQGRPGYSAPYSLVQAAIPLGIGLRYKYKQRLNISIEAGVRFTFTDHLDDVGGLYPDPNVFAGDELAARMSNRSLEPIAARTGRDRTAGVRQYLVQNQGFPNDPNLDPFVLPIQGQTVGDNRGGGNKDFYLLTAIHINYILKSPIKCPPIR
jgi:hypothetical protein